MERVNTNLDDTSIVNSLGIEIAFINCIGNVTHYEHFFGFLSLVDSMIEYQIKYGFCEIALIS
jgi:hypothetical protein